MYVAHSWLLSTLTLSQRGLRASDSPRLNYPIQPHFAHQSCERSTCTRCPSWPSSLDVDGSEIDGIAGCERIQQETNGFSMTSRQLSPRAAIFRVEVNTKHVTRRSVYVERVRSHKYESDSRLCDRFMMAKSPSEHLSSTDASCPPEVNIYTFHDHREISAPPCPTEKLIELLPLPLRRPT